MIDRTKSASSRRLALSVSSMPSWERHERQVVSLISRLTSVIGAFCVRLGAARQLAGLGGRVGGAVAALAGLHDPDVARCLAARRLEYLRGLLLGHGAGRVARLAGWEVDQLDYVPADEVVDLGSADRAAKRALDHHERALAEHSAEFLEELVGVGRREVLELGLADLRIDPLLGLAGDGRHRVRVSLDRVEPVLDALLDGVGGRRADAGVDLVAELVEVVLGFGLGPAADAWGGSRLPSPCSRARACRRSTCWPCPMRWFRRHGRDGVSSVGDGGWLAIGHRSFRGFGVLLPSTVTQDVPRRPSSDCTIRSVTDIGQLTDMR